tara:strand:- start:356 stop:541 length:186 start_codon:yes stop_codon:yes gene_type:complete
MKIISNSLRNQNTGADFNEIDVKLLEGFECSSFDTQNKKFLSMMREQTDSAFNNKKYWSTS